MGLAALAPAQITIDAVAPEQADPGDSGVTVVATLSGTLPPDVVQPTSFRIGTLDGSNLARPSSATVSADFDFSTDFAEGSYDATIVFSPALPATSP
jgi:hypothetical protein